MESELNGSGLQYAVEYLGSIPVESSVQEMLSTDLRKLVVLECIYILADAHNLIKTKRDVNTVAKKVIGNGDPKLCSDGDKPAAVDLNLSAKQFRIVRKEGMLARHPLTHVSFAAQGAGDTEGFVGYVAKKADGSDRRCFVFRFDEANLLMSAIHEAMRLYAKAQGLPSLPTPSPQQQPHNNHHHNNSHAHSQEPTDIVTVNVCELEPYPWYHGILSRSVAEPLLQDDGDFLVRQSTNSPGQIILSGREGRVANHILLIDNNKVKTQEREFSSVLELINFHYKTGAWIICEESSLRLIRPIPRT